MKMRKIFPALLLAIFITLTTVTTALALPPLPSTFHGTVKDESGKNVPTGSVVYAYINGVQYAYTTVILFGGDTVYSIKVPGDDPATSRIEGGTAGQTVTFYVQTDLAHPTGVWTSGVNQTLNLTIPVPTAVTLVELGAHNARTIPPIQALLFGATGLTAAGLGVGGLRVMRKKRS